jgi:hypothetical protein
LDGDLSHIAGWFDAQDGNASLAKAIEQIPIVTGNLHDGAGGSQAQMIYDVVGIAPRVIEPRLRVRRVVRVLTEDLLRRHIFLQLDEEALVADIGVERVEELHVVEFALVQK